MTGGSTGTVQRDRARCSPHFTAAWERGEAPAAEDYLDRLDPADSRAAVELIYREFCLAEADGCKPDAAEFLYRVFPQHKPALERSDRLHGECSPSLLGRWMETTPSLDFLPQAGDAIGPFFLMRELGKGAFARVFLAEQTDLENRLVVLKVSTRMTREPWLLARVRHAHIVEIVSHATVDDGAFHLICMPFWGGRLWRPCWRNCQGGTSALRRRGLTCSRPRFGRRARVSDGSYAAARPAKSWRGSPIARRSHGWSRGWPRRLTTPLAAMWLTATSSLRTSCCRPTPIRCSLDFNLARDCSPAARGDRPSTPAERSPTWLPSGCTRLPLDE